MHSVSIWSKTARRPQFEPLKRDIKTDVLIIGGGLTGLLCAHKLTESGVRCVVAEADRICSGVTKNTTAKVTVQHGLIYDRIVRESGVGAAKLYYAAQSQALAEYERLSHLIDCDFERQPSFVYSCTNAAKIKREAEALQRIGCDAKLTQSTPLPFSVAAAVGIQDQAQFHPLKFAYGLAKHLPIYENTKIQTLFPGGAITPHGKIMADKIIIATHFPILNKHGGYFLKMYQHRSYVIALQGAGDFEGMYVDEDSKGLSFRHANGLLLLGGGSHRTGKQGGAWKELEQFAHTHYPRASVVARWATQDCMTLDGLPYIGQYAPHTHGLFVATGYNKWGMTSAMAAASLLCDLVQGKQNEYAQIFAPDRSMLHAQLAVNAAEAMRSILTPTAPRCPHMGCALKYNAAEHSWDCPCHGSRFTEQGQVIDNPATDDKKGMGSERS
ncbi:MAG: FAD-dependent oxidoreductase [Clostridia bacterium]|nr:FAD-dependent oxidoreductase [Clostridia bacterium]